MASRKLTQLPTATEVTALDKIYIVDVSDTTESPQGTSKQAVISELPSSGITSITSTDGSISVDNTDPNAPDLSIQSGDFLPTITSITGGASVNVSSGFYYRSGADYVTMIFGCDVSMGVSSVSTSFKFDLPIASNFSNSRQLLGTNNNVENMTLCTLNSSESDNLGEVNIFATANGDVITGLQITAIYKIL